MSGGGGEHEASVLETPVLMLAAVMAFFLVVTGGFEFIVHKARTLLIRHDKLGLLAALNSMTNELMLLGVASLLLLMIQRNVAGLCFAEGDYKMRTWLDSVDGCACCLSRTRGVSSCYLKERGCGSTPEVMKACCAPLEGKGRSCDNPGYFEELLRAAAASSSSAEASGVPAGSPGSADASPAADAHRGHLRLRSLLAPSPLDSHGGSDGTATCAGRAEVGIGGCPPGKRPAVSISALHEVHTFIFAMALAHIFACVLLIVMASLRVRSWRKWEQSAVADEGSDAAGAAGGSAKATSASTAKSGRALSSPSVSAVAAVAAAPAADADDDAELGGVPAAGPPSTKARRPSLLERDDGRRSGGEIDGVGRAGFDDDGTKRTVQCEREERELQRQSNSSVDKLSAAADAPHPSRERRSRSVLLQRPAELRGFWPKLGEVAICTLRQLLLVFPVSRREFLEMREAWMSAHKLVPASSSEAAGAGGGGAGGARSRVAGAGGDVVVVEGKTVAGSPFSTSASALPPISFSDYVMKSFDDDVAGIVGLGMPMWILLIVFLLLSDRIGWCIWVFLVFAGAMLLALAVKLASIVRYMSRARLPDEGTGKPNELDPNAFFFRRPWLMLPPIKLLLFFVSLVWSNAVFFASSFGKRSCFFSRKGLQNVPVSWWGVVVASVLMFVALAINVMPSYALCVHLGLDHKPHLLPTDEHREHFRAVAEQRRREEEERERKAEREAEDEKRRTKKRSQLSKMVSRRLPMQRDISASRSVSSEHH